jgi:hypothetical protein
LWLKISIATGVHHQSLLNNDDPLLDSKRHKTDTLDISGNTPLASKSKTFEHLARVTVDKETLSVLVAAALDAAIEKELSYQFQFLIHGGL